MRDTERLIKKEYAFGLDEKLFTPEAEGEKNKNMFHSYVKKLDLEIKLNEQVLQSKKNDFEKVKEIVEEDRYSKESFLR